VDELKQRLIDIWHRFKQNVVDGAVDEWRKCHKLKAQGLL